MTTSTEPLASRQGAPRTTPRRRVRGTPLTWVRRGGLANLLFLLPLLGIFGVFSWGPIVESVIISLQHTNFVVTTWSDPIWSNFEFVFRDPTFWLAVRNTGYFALLALIFGYPVPIVLAVIMSEVKRFKGLFSVLAYLPVVVLPVVSVLLWKNVFYDAGATGVFNIILSWFHIPAQPWIQSTATAMPSLVLEATWAAAGGTIIIYLAALTNVPPELYDAAEVDGAGIWQKLWHVTLPQLRGIMLVTFILQIIGTSQVFLEPYLFTQGGPVQSTTTIMLLIFQYAFQSSDGGSNLGVATALSLMLAAFLAVFSAVYFRVTRSWSQN
ncbi:MAG: multiple sugar transport system permease protein [Actinomycetota bacterium]|jgi:multiple sugar transport system permease protein|nr:multiple sugar transport system permease protein [Actinomycetota bacterium]MDQ1551388.1 multiple sugar transport system permease protein [Actinomycetota bacterium]